VPVVSQRHVSLLVGVTSEMSSRMYKELIDEQQSQVKCKTDFLIPFLTREVVNIGYGAEFST